MRVWYASYAAMLFTSARPQYTIVELPTVGALELSSNPPSVAASRVPQRVQRATYAMCNACIVCNMQRAPCTMLPSNVHASVAVLSAVSE